MKGTHIYGYAGKILRVDLSNGDIIPETLDEALLRKYIGGVSLGAKFLYDEVPPGIEWSAPENRIFLGSGPLGGTKIGGSGTIIGVTKGALTHGGASSQANGFFGAYLRSCGFDAILLQGSAPRWVYLYIHDGKAELRDAAHLLGKDTFDTERLIKDELSKPVARTSILSIGPAGENLVRFALISSDMGHMLAHNGFGAVMGSKQLKAIAVKQGKHSIPLMDGDALSRLVKEIREETHSIKFYDHVSKNGTVGGVARAIGIELPVKNYSTSIFAIDQDRLETYTSKSIREKFKVKGKPCWACNYDHGSIMQIPDGKYSGLSLEEPEYECMASWSSQVGITDVTATMVLANIVDRLGMDTNEASWVIGWVLECFEKGILTKKETDGITMTWGNSEAIMEMIRKIAHRQGFGNILAEGVMRAARYIGGEATNLAIHTLKGNTPRSHDHRNVWLELFDTCVSNTGTLESHKNCRYEQLGLPPTYDPFDPETISTMEAKIKGAMMFEDCVGACRFNTATNLALLTEAVNAATGWDLDIEEAMMVGRRGVNLLRVFNLRNGIGGELDAPSLRYGSTPIDGPAAGRGIMPHWDTMVQNYYHLMGWDEKGKPLPETLSRLGLEDIIQDLWD